MNDNSLPPDDSSPSKTTRLDRLLNRKLEKSLEKLFLASCHEYTQTLLSDCDWYITTQASAVTLVIACPDMKINWQVLNNIVSLGMRMEQLANSAKIRVYPPMGMGTLFEIRVDEIAVYQDYL